MWLGSCYENPDNILPRGSLHQSRNVFVSLPHLIFSRWGFMSEEATLFLMVNSRRGRKIGLLDRQRPTTHKSFSAAWLHTMEQLVFVTLNKQHNLVSCFLNPFNYTHTLTTDKHTETLFLFLQPLCQLQSLLPCYTSQSPYKSTEAHKHVITHSHTHIHTFGELLLALL